MVTLLLPVGPPGSGKTYLGKKLKDIYKDRMIYLSRDDLFNSFRKENSIRNAKHLTHKYIKEELQKNINTDKIIYIDTTNSNEGIRQLYISYLNPKIIKFICFKYDISILINRVDGRYHPTFPTDKVKQLTSINKIYNSIDYPIDNTIEINDENYNLDNIFSFL